MFWSKKGKSMWHSENTQVCVFILNEGMFWKCQGISTSNTEHPVAISNCFWIGHAQSLGRNGGGHLEI